MGAWSCWAWAHLFSQLQLVGGTSVGRTSAKGTIMVTSSRRRRWVAAVILVTVFGLLLTLQSLPLNSAAAKTGKSRVVSGWFGPWTSADEMIRIGSSSRGVLGEVNIFWWDYRGWSNPVCTYGLASCGASSRTPWTSRKYAAAVRGLQAKGIHVYASHTDLSASRARSLSTYLATRKHRRALANKLTTWAVRSGVNGVDLDWENFAFNDGTSTWSATKPRFITTIRILSRKLHAAGKRLSVTVPAGYQPFRNRRPNRGGGYWVYAWREIAPMVDRLRLMAYDYSLNRPGPIGPHGWARRVTKSAVAQVGRANRRKVYIGVHQYGKAWYVRDSRDNYVTRGKCRSNWRPSGANSIALGPGQAASVAAAYGRRPRFHSGHREWNFRYLKSQAGTFVSKKGKTRRRTCNVWKKIWYGDAATAVARGDLVKKYGIGGIAVWQLASTRSDFYPRMRRLTGRRLTARASVLRPRAGSTVTIRGQLSAAGSGVRIKRQWKHNGRWRTKARARTNSHGRVSFRVRLLGKPRSYKFRLKRGKLKSTTIRIVAKPAPKIRFTRSSSAAGAVVKFRAEVAPPVRGQRVARQMKRDGRWRTLQADSTNKAGVARFRTVLFTKPQVYRYRVRVHPSTRTSGGYSKVMRFRSR
jgi:spore germination protein YaaH